MLGAGATNYDAIVVLPFAIPVLIAGIWLIKAGFWPRRIGYEKRCRRCDYIVEQLQSDRCPECGTELTPTTIRHGRRHRRPGRILIGVFLMLVGIAALSPFSISYLRQVDWYRFKPDAWVLQDLSSTLPSLQRQALAELRRRRDAGDLSQSTTRGIIQLTLTEQAAATRKSRELLDLLASSSLYDAMSKAEREKFFSKIITLGLIVRPTVLVGDGVPFLIFHHSSGPSAGQWWVRLRSKGVSIDQGKLIQAGGATSGPTGMGAGRFGSHIRCEVPGEHVLHATVGVEVFRGPMDRPEDSILEWSKDVQLQHPFTVLAARPDDYIQAIDDPSLADLIRRALRPRDFRINLKEQTIEGWVNVQSAPVNIAFDVVVRHGTNECVIGRVREAKGASMQHQVGGRLKLNTTAAATQVDLILRPNEKLVRDTTDLYSYWNGELVFPDVSVEVSEDRQ